jgi:hypothetical protein
MIKPMASFVISEAECVAWSNQYQKRAIELYEKGTLTPAEDDEYKKSLFLAGLLEEVVEQMGDLPEDSDEDVSPEELN